MTTAPYTHSTTRHHRVPSLEHAARGKGVFLQFYDPDGQRFGIPTYPYRWAPQGMLTVRQLRAKGLRPGGQQVAAQIMWRRGKRVAYLYHENQAKPKRTATPGQQAAIGRALRARRTCPTCGTEKWYYTFPVPWANVTTAPGGNTMPRRNRNAKTTCTGTDELAAEIRELATRIAAVTRLFCAACRTNPATEGDYCPLCKGHIVLSARKTTVTRR